MKIVVIGAGITGSLIGYRLATAGAQVTIIEAGQPTSAASGASFGWINASFYADRDHFNLRAAGIEAHRRLAADLQSDATQWPGCLCWEQDGHAFDVQYKALKDLGYSVTEISAATFSQMEPQVRAPARALHFADEGCVDLVALASDARRAGARKGLRVLAGLRVIGLVEKSGQISGVRTPSGVIEADRVIVAAGIEGERILAQVGQPLLMLKRPGLIVRSEILPPLVRHILVSPDQELRQTAQGHLIAPAAASHQSDESDSINTPPDGLADLAMRRVTGLVGRDVAWEQVTLANRPVPADGLPVIGACGPSGLYVSVMHSGATLAPLVAEMAQVEVMDRPLSNAQGALLSPYRPARFKA